MDYYSRNNFSQLIAYTRFHIIKMVQIEQIVCTYNNEFQPHGPITYRNITHHLQGGKSNVVEVETPTDVRIFIHPCLLSAQHDG